MSSPTPTDSRGLEPREALQHVLDELLDTTKGYTPWIDQAQAKSMTRQLEKILAALPASPASVEPVDITRALDILRDHVPDTDAPWVADLAHDIAETFDAIRHGSSLRPTARPSVEPVAWRWRAKVKGEWGLWSAVEVDPNDWTWRTYWDEIDVEPLYATTTLSALSLRVGGLEGALTECASPFARGDGGPNLIPFHDLSNELARRQSIAARALATRSPA